MVEALPKHLHLDYTVEAIAAQRVQHHLALFFSHIVVDFCRLKSALLVQGADLTGVIDRAGGSDDLMVKSCMFSHHQAATNACFDDMTVTFRGECNPSSEPCLFPKCQD